MHAVHDLRGLTHICDFSFRLDAALPVHQSCRIDKFCIRQVLLQGLKRLGREVVIVHLNADAQSAPAAIFDNTRQLIHRVALCGLHIDIRIGQDVIVVHVNRAIGTVGILIAPPPDWQPIRWHQDALMNIKRPTVISGQPGHVGRVGHPKQINALGVHGLAGLGQTRGIFRSREGQIGSRHIFLHSQRDHHKAMF